ncbi:Rpn family recombination-promoting nuclease/putative transposase [Aureispira anguillae]|uniref:Rpn family recombination-promoting nuclease/putative transposase n=1 Tax=Aureispira anguillae TaxID=2864201 RepID=A0A916DP51_9BACT|nr:Rpn family recombination-promoting nuclease/putative transposase [Aureispira anguillae]BDS09951.1 Rpn family recombination-promoting nuclease/putative transposase [Aureispira anguillae]
MNLKDKYINPLTDFGFKKLFGIEPNKELLIDFLNQLLPSFHQIKNLSYTKNEHLGNTPLERKAIFDLYCESASGEKFIVEVQKAKQNFFKDRSVFYSTFPIQEQAKKGDWDFQLTAVYTIGILDFVFDEHKDRDDILHTVKLKDHKNRLFYDKLTYIYIELPKFTKEVAQLESKFDKWLYIFRHLANLQNRPIALQERIFQKLFEAAEIAKFSPKEKQLYEESLKYYRDLKNVVDTSKAEGIEEGIKKGIEKGMKKGIEKGMKKGIEKGRQDVAKEMKADGFSVSKIAQYTGLSEDEINRL